MDFHAIQQIEMYVLFYCFLTAIEKDGDKGAVDFRIAVTDIVQGNSYLSNLKNGLSYLYYEGEWDSIPDFNTIKSIKKGVIENIEAPSDQSKENFGIHLKGYIKILEEGIYCFYLRSDDGSKLLIDDKLIIDNDGLHDNSLERNGFIGLKQGNHSIEILFFERGMGQSLDVSYAGPGITKQKIPGNVLYYTGN